MLAAAGSAEIDGTTTNLEGRVSTVTQKITAPGTARGDWMLAADLAPRLGADLGVESAGRCWPRSRPWPRPTRTSAARLVAAGGDGVLVEGSDR